LHRAAASGTHPRCPESGPLGLSSPRSPWPSWPRSRSRCLPGAPIATVSEVQGAVGEPVPTAAASEAPPPVDARLLYQHPTDRDTPLTARELLPAQPGELTGYVWPLTRGRISLPFKDIPGGTRIRDGKLMHDGVDMATFCGDTVRAAHDGVVLAAGRHFDDQIGWVGDLAPYYRTLDRKKLWDDLPNVVIIDDGNGYRSVYAHMSRLTVRVGDRVRAGGRIGYEGATGHASGCHVHYGLFSPLETKDVRRPGGHREAPPHAAARDRPDRPAARPAGRRRGPQDPPRTDARAARRAERATGPSPDRRGVGRRASSPPPLASLPSNVRRPLMHSNGRSHVRLRCAGLRSARGHR
jgi:murein DD-endopeptidase MepM/ murein hydrolase activator NlpD